MPAKTLHLLRHAKSSWDDASLVDIDRPLNGRGIAACARMAPHLVAAGCTFEAVFCSPAQRARSTIELIAQALPAQDITWTVVEDLYTFSSDDLYAWCRALPESLTDVMLVGHNPALTDFCNSLSDSDLHNIPTCGYAQLKARAGGAWSDLAQTPFALAAFLRPKHL
jgi:phosphohistidine phosphatase